MRSINDDRRNYNYRQQSSRNQTPAGQNTAGSGQQPNASQRPFQDPQRNRQYQQTRQIPTVNRSAPPRSQTQRPNANPQARMQSNTMQQTRVQNTVRKNAAPANRPNPNASVAFHRETAAPAPRNRDTGFIGYFKKAFAVDRTVLEKRDLVREMGSIDYPFLIIVLILLAFGTVMVYSASYAYSKNEYNDSYYIIFRQFIFIFIGFFVMAFAAWFRPEWYKKFTVLFYIICFFLLTLVPFIGVVHHGARRWLSLGFIEIQPSEFMKLGLVLMLAWYFDRYYERITDPSENLIRASFFGVFTPLAITGVTCVLVLIEKHMSGTIIMFLIGVIIIFASGTRLHLLYGLGGLGVIGLAILSITTDYTKRRIDIWLHPEHDPLNDGYQTLQGLYAIGSGGFFGVGLGESRQKHMYVSQPQNDFIFTIVCEELGFVGALAVILLFILFIWRGCIIAMKAPDTYSALVVLGIVGKVAIQSVLNIAVVTNSIPNTGISLPFFSYGGSSLLVLMAEMGIVLSISRFSKQKK